MTQQTFSTDLFNEIFLVFKDHFKLKDKRIQLLVPLKGSLPNTYGEIEKLLEARDVTKTFCKRLIEVLQAHPDELQVVVKEPLSIENAFVNHDQMQRTTVFEMPLHSWYE